MKIKILLHVVEDCYMKYLIPQHMLCPKPEFIPPINLLQLSLPSSKHNEPVTEATLVLIYRNGNYKKDLSSRMA